MYLESSVATDVGTDSLTMEENKIEAFNQYKLNNDTMSENSLEAFNKAPNNNNNNNAGAYDQAPINPNENKVSQRINQCKSSFFFK